MDTLGTKTPPTLDGLHLASVSSDSLEIEEVELHGLVELSDGSVREQRPYQGEGYPETRVRYRFALDYRHLAGLTEAVEGRLAFAGLHTFCVWKHVALGYRGDGVRNELFLPTHWRLATHSLTPPQGLSVGRFDPVVRLGFETPELVVWHLDPEDFDAGIPEEGEVWFERGSHRFKLFRAGLAGELISVRVVPLFQVFKVPESQRRRFGDPLREPRRIVLQER